MNLVWDAPHAMAVEFRNGGGRVALTIGCFGVVRSGHVRFSVCGTRVRDEWQRRALGELLVRRLEVAVLGKCADLHATSVEMTLPGGQCHLRVASLLMYSKCGWQISHRSKEAVSSERLRGLVVARKLEVLDEAHAEYPRRDVGAALEPAKAAAAKALRKAIARAQVRRAPPLTARPPSRVMAHYFLLQAQVTEATAEAVRLAEADFDYAQSMLSLAKAQSAREQKGKHRPPDARAAQQQRWAKTVELWASEADAAWRVRSEARGRLGPADVALRGEQARFAQLHTRGYAMFTRGEHGVRIPSPETVAGEVGNWMAVFNKGVDQKSKQPERGGGWSLAGAQDGEPGRGRAPP